jgi:tetratricopeptide (TPR) repeat protein
MATALKNYQQLLEICRKHTASHGASIRWQCWLLSVLATVSILLDQRGQSAAADIYREEFVAAGEKLAEQCPSHIGLNCEVARAHEHLGVTLQQQGDLDGALRHNEAALGILRRLVARNPSDRIRSFLAYCIMRGGDLVQAAGDASGALALFGESGSILQGLLGVDPSNVEWQGALGTCHEALGELLQRKDPAAAIDHFRQALPLVHHAIASDPLQPYWWDCLPRVMGRLADTLAHQGKAQEARSCYEECIASVAQLSEGSGGTLARSTLGCIHEGVAHVRLALGEPDASFMHYQESLRIRQQVAAEVPSNGLWQCHLAIAHEDVGDALELRGDLAGAVKSYELSVSIRQELLAQGFTVPPWRGNLSKSQKRLRSLVDKLRASHGAKAG